MEDTYYIAWLNIENTFHEEGSPRRSDKLPEILAVTTATNLRSQAVMRRIGMTCDSAEDFGDLAEPQGPLRRNVGTGS